jgi:hypothetical protein
MKFMFSIILGLLSVTAMLGPLTACDKDPEVIIETKHVPSLLLTPLP